MYNLSSDYLHYCVPINTWLGDTCSVLVETVILVVETGRRASIEWLWVVNVEGEVMRYASRVVNVINAAVGMIIEVSIGSPTEASTEIDMVDCMSGTNSADVAVIDMTEGVLLIEGCPPLKLEVLGNCDGCSIAIEILLLSGSVRG
jgi:hypothetical protein